MMRPLFMCLLIAGLAGSVHAQSIPAFRGNNAAHYRFGDPNDLTIEVKVWGAVNNPGLYEVRENMSLSTLLSLAGGPRMGMPESRSASTFKVRLFRLQAQGRYQLFSETTMDNEIVALVQDPILLNGDMLIAEERTRLRFGWRDGLSIVAAVASVLLVVDNVFRN